MASSDQPPLTAEQLWKKRQELLNQRLPRAQPCASICELNTPVLCGTAATHRLEFDAVNKIYTPVKIPAYERD